VREEVESFSESVVDAANHEAPFYFSYPKEVLHDVVFQYLSGNAAQRQREKSVRMLVLALYLKLGRSAEEVSQEIQTRGHSLSPNGVRQLAFKLKRRAEKRCAELNLGPRPAEPEGVGPHFDHHQFEGRFRMNRQSKVLTADDCKSLVEHVLTFGHVERALEGERGPFR